MRAGATCWSGQPAECRLLVPSARTDTHLMCHKVQLHTAWANPTIHQHPNSPNSLSVERDYWLQIGNPVHPCANPRCTLPASHPGCSSPSKDPDALHQSYDDFSDERDLWDLLILGNIGRARLGG